jgi:putative mRNA 3-end processing factor
VALLELDPRGLYCPSGGFYVDPWAVVDRAVITHAHHARGGSGSYLAAEPGAALLRECLGDEATIESLPYGRQLLIGGVSVSLHPAGHILGSAQVRIERGGEVWVVSGDYKLAPDPACAAFEPVACNTFVTEGTFGLPIFRWPEATVTMDAIHGWWRGNLEAGRASVLFAHPLGIAQRLLAALNGSIGTICAHPEIERFSRHYREQKIALAPTAMEGDARALVLAPPSAQGSDWLKTWSRTSTAMASGWMRIRGPRRRRTLDRGFVLSNHADWPGLLAAIDATQAETVWVTHERPAPLVRWLTEHGRAAVAVEAHFAEDEA